ncbi:low temperature requirement protein A [Phyllobacterium leguminum]|uniref:Low temperature requirement protein LtrA n=1 Tax=Phyllobacterium leguminum TaxID=314237 RepID=A0A318T2K7_9HYPH|nr:low temperature requirement protein A [Phyllobacterium leguminum]PYE87036.1 low temperature requirement protein LtrA [Phyllobacterium leguminum]
MIRLMSIRFTPRDRHEAHRVATPLELMFDLASVIAIAAAAHGLAHAVEQAHITQGVVAFLCSFFMIWLAWMNYTWFASAYDDNSTGFRVLSMVIMFGALILAAGIGAVFDQQPIWLALLGFIVMRLGMALFWLGAAKGDPERRRTALRYASGICFMQLYWIALVTLMPPTATLYLPMFLLGAAGELAAPAIAERHGVTNWHRHHMIERYGLLNIIVLGECFIAITAMVHLESGAALPDAGHLWLALLSAAIAFSMWGLYFTDDDHLADAKFGQAFLWGYGHFALFAAGAATGAGLTVKLAAADHGAQVDPQTAVMAIALPVAIYVATLWVIRDRICLDGAGRWLLLAVAALIVIIGATAPMAMELITMLLISTALFRRRITRTREGIIS